MAVVIGDNNVPEEEYKDEKELEKILCKNPTLLQSDDKVELFLLGSQVPLGTGAKGGTGKLDILYLDSNKNIVVVEVKRNKNSQSKRDVLAQILDYVSDIANLSYHELDELTNGELQKVVCEKFQGDVNAAKIIENNLRQDIAKLIIAVDKANDGLKKIVQFLCDRTNLDIALIEILKYKQGNCPVFVSNAVVRRSVNKYALLDKLVKYCENNKLLNVIPRENYWSIVHTDGWDSKMFHYEFVLRGEVTGDDIGVEFHFERKISKEFSDERRKEVVAAIIAAIEKIDIVDESGRCLINGCPIKFVPDMWAMLRIAIPFYQKDFEYIVRTMQEFIEKTKPAIEDVLRKEGLLNTRIQKDE